MTLEELQKLVPELEWQIWDVSEGYAACVGYEGEVLRGFAYLEGIHFSIDKTEKLCLYLNQSPIQFEWFLVDEFRRRLKLRAFE